MSSRPTIFKSASSSDGTRISILSARTSLPAAMFGWTSRCPPNTNSRTNTISPSNSNQNTWICNSNGTSPGPWSSWSY
ncbi:hypothetical protein BDW75DRAFT_206873 [Aspergillus navahoensis]